TKKQFMFIKHKSVKIISLGIMTVIAYGIYVAPEFNSGWLLASKSYIDLGLPQYGGLARLLVYATSTMMAISVLAWIPQMKGLISSLGSRTIYVYLLHGFFIQYFRVADLFKVDHVFDVIGLAVLSALIVFVLSSKFVLGIWQPF